MGGVSAAVPGRGSAAVASIGVSPIDPGPADEETLGSAVRSAAQRLSAILLR